MNSGIYQIHFEFKCTDLDPLQKSKIFIYIIYIYFLFLLFILFGKVFDLSMYESKKY